MRALTSIALAALALLTASESAAREILIPNVVAFARGSYDSLWGTEIRLINPTSSPKSFRVVDWIGSPRQVPYEVTVPAGQTVSVGGFRLYSNWPNPIHGLIERNNNWHFHVADHAEDYIRISC